MNPLSTLLRALGLIAVVAASAPSLSQVYKTTDPSGHVQYSDRPPPGAALIPSKNESDAWRELQGTWSVANATMNGELFEDSKIVGATWSFRDNELRMEPRKGEAGRFSIKLEMGATPKAFRATAVQPAGERGGWMIYAREGARLRIAFMDNLEGRPTGFEPQRKLVVVTLVPKREDGKGMTAANKQQACEILRVAGVMDLLGPTAKSTTDKISDPATQCRFEQPMGTVTLGLIRATNRSVLEREREKQATQALTSAAHMVVQDEPELGPSAFSVTRGYTAATYLLKGDTMIILILQLPAVNQALYKPFVQRVIAAT